MKKNNGGFTLVEVMVATVLLLLLALISIPVYMSQVDTAKKIEGIVALSDLNIKMQEYYFENNTFVGSCNSYVNFLPKNISDYNYNCLSETETTYLIEAVKDNVSYKIDQNGNKTTIIRGGSGVSVEKNCWVSFKDGVCL